MEIWKPVPDIDEYLISNYGRVKSLKCGRNKIMIGNINNKGYHAVSLHKNTKIHTRKVHTLVAMAFLGYKMNGKMDCVIDHIDHNKLNNHVDNLQIISNRENVVRDGRRGKTSKYVGVHFDKRTNKFISQIYYNKKHYFLGRYKTELEASRMYQEKLKEINNY